MPLFIKAERYTIIADIPYPYVEYTICSLEVCNIHRGEAEVNIISPRVNKSYIQRERVWNICFIPYHADFKRNREKDMESTWYSWVIAKFCPMLIKVSNHHPHPLPFAY